MSGIKRFRVKLAELFRELLDEEGSEVAEIEAANAMAGMAAMICQTRGPEWLDTILKGIPEVVERDIAKYSKRFDYQVIPTNEGEPIRRGTVMLPKHSSTKDLRRAVEPHLDNAHLQRAQVIVEAERRDMFIDDLAMICRVMNAPLQSGAMLTYRSIPMPILSRCTISRGLRCCSTNWCGSDASIEARRSAR
jgi:hypothetical protein